MKRLHKTWFEDWERWWRFERLSYGAFCLLGAWMCYHKLYEDHYSAYAEIAREIGDTPRTSASILMIMGTAFLLVALWLLGRAALGPRDRDSEKEFDERRHLDPVPLCSTHSGWGYAGMRAYIKKVTAYVFTTNEFEKAQNDGQG